MTDKDFEVLQTALSPEVSESEEQVRLVCDLISSYNVNTSSITQLMRRMKTINWRITNDELLTKTGRVLKNAAFRFCIA